MKPALGNRSPTYFSDWQQLPCGKQLQQLTEQAINQCSRQFFGYHLVQLGDLTSQLNLSDCPIKHKVKQTRQALKDSGLLSLAESLPYQENSIDAFILAHELDFAQDPHQILRQINYAIIPNGHVVISGFNPFSLAGITHLLPIKRQQPLHQARFFSAARIKDWLQLLGFEIVDDQRMLFSELLYERHIDLHSRWQTIPQKYLNRLGSLYVIVAKKRESTLTLIKPKWQVSRNIRTVGASVQAWPRLEK